MRPAVAVVVGLSVWLSLWLAAFCVTTDTFLCLVIGRDIAAHGLPSTNTLTVLQHGAPWSDQQWLSHVVLNRVSELAGFGGLLLLRVLTTVVACGLALGYAARRGASTLGILLGGALGLALILFKAKVRGQMFAEPLFVGLCIVLLSSQRELSWRALGVAAAIMLLWSNVHGSVLLGVALIGLATATKLVVQSRAQGVRRTLALGDASLRRDLLLCVLAVLSLFATPYGARLWDYYRGTLGNPLFRQYISEWGSADWEQSSFLIVISVVSAGLLLFAGTAASMFERVLLALMIGFSLYSVRQALFLGLLLLLILPPLIDRALPPRLRAFSGARALRVLAFVIAIPALLFSLLSVKVFDGVVAQQWPERTSAIVGALAGATGKVFATVSHADRLLWRQPELAGRIAFDARFELLSGDQLAVIAGAMRDPNREWLREFSVFVVDATAKGALERHGFELIAEDAQAVVYRRPR